MNRVFKTKWSVAHQEYVVTDEKHTTKTKAAKSAVALAVAALMLGAGAASAAYMAPKGGSQETIRLRSMRPRSLGKQPNTTRIGASRR